jgi:hypothetical protein
MAIVTIKLERTFSLRRHHRCLFCGGSTDKDSVNAIVYSAVIDVTPGQRAEEATDLVVCAECLGRDDAGLKAVLRENAAGLRERAGELEAIAADLPALPSRLAWEAANDAADAEDGETGRVH